MNPIKIALNYVNASKSEEEVERFFKAFLPGTPWAGHVKAVGGYVRDLYLRLLKNDPNISADDLDAAIDIIGGAKDFTHELYNKFKPAISEPAQLGVEKGYPIWQITFKENIVFNGENFKTKGSKFELADTQSEKFTDPKSRQREVTPVGDFKIDLKRRDFTIGMLLKDLTTGNFEDLTGFSKKDIEEGVLREHPDVDAAKMFSDDPVRVLRLIRFFVKYNMKLPRYLLRAVQSVADQLDPKLGKLKVEDMQKEIKKISALGKLKAAVQLMMITGIHKYIAPELEALRGTKQSPEHHAEGDAYRHTLMVLDMAKPGVESQLAALLHDIGKPSTTEFNEVKKKLTSYGHDAVGAELAEKILRRLKFDNSTIEKVKNIVKHHMKPHFLHENLNKPLSVIKFIRTVGKDTLDAVLDMAEADEKGKKPTEDKIKDVREKVNELRDQVADKPMLSGKEVMDALDIKQGPQIGVVMKYILDLEDRSLAEGKTLTKEQIIDNIKNKFKKGKNQLLTGQEVMETLGITGGPEVGQAMTFLKELQNKGPVTKEEAKKELLNHFNKKASTLELVKKVSSRWILADTLECPDCKSKKEGPDPKKTLIKCPECGEFMYSPDPRKS